MSDDLTPADAAERFEAWIGRTGFAVNTKKQYPAHVRAFTRWLADHGDEYHDALTGEHGRDYAVRDYREHLLTVDKKAPATVEAAMSALTAFYDTYLTLGKPKVPRQNTNRDDVRGLEAKELKAVLRAAERRGPRDFALTMLLYGCAPRVAEAAALDRDDLLVTDRSGWLEVRHGKGGKSRSVPVLPEVRAALKPWLAGRKEKYGDLGPLFVSREGHRLSVRRMQSLMGEIGESAGVDLHPHALRHTMARKFLADGGTLPQLQRFLGHSSLASTQVYVRPSNSALAEFVETMRIEL